MLTDDEKGPVPLPGRCLKHDWPAVLYADGSMSCWWEAVVESSGEHEPERHFALWKIEEMRPSAVVKVNVYEKWLARL